MLPDVLSLTLPICGRRTCRHGQWGRERMCAVITQRVAGARPHSRGSKWRRLRPGRAAQATGAICPGESRGWVGGLRYTRLWQGSQA